MTKSNIVLIGMPGCGKSTVGVILAKVLKKRFVDTDLVIQEKTGKLLRETIAEEGIEGFNAIEDRILASLQAEDAVIATGGSAVYGANAMAHLREIGLVVYLRLSYAGVEARLGSLEARGVVHRPGQTLRDLYEERILLYEQYADIVVDEDYLDIEATVECAVGQIEGAFAQEGGQE
ncbi:shikimate kinase [Shuttleworthella satelles]|uniref:Shikimate kinase n=1 Tax=Shuttleworthella satelles DSM 14600 TaxID=626523 RepID=C4G8K0_9FIRM|nr:shikimate kinase [Shuttleworthia satelles]EEP28947.1 shikimate kinase [Shuttleworthia satelles DSM 14600]